MISSELFNYFYNFLSFLTRHFISDEISRQQNLCFVASLLVNFETGDPGREVLISWWPWFQRLESAMQGINHYPVNEHQKNLLSYPLGRDFQPMDSAFQQMNQNPLYKYQQNLLNCPMNSDYMAGEMVQNSGNSQTFILTAIC